MALNRGFILRTTKYQEADLLLDVFTLDQGVITLTAKNIRRPRSKRHQVCEILNLIDFQVQTSRKNPDFQFLTEARLVSNFQSLKNVDSLFSESFVLAEILSKVLPKSEPHPDVFALLSELATSSVQTQQSAKFLLCYILINTLNFLGYLPNLKTCQLSQEPINATANIASLREQTGFCLTMNPTDQDKLYALQVLKTLNYFLTLPSPDQFKSLKLSDSLLNYMLNLELDWVTAILEVKLKSRELIRVQA